MVRLPLQHYSLSHNIAVIGIIALLYFLTGTIGILFALPGTTVSPIWIPSGVAVALTLMYGSRVALAVFLGASLLNFFSLWEICQHSSLIRIAIVGCCMAMGASLQAIVCADLVKYYIRDKGQTFYVDRPQYVSSLSVVQFLIIALAACMVSSNIGTSALVLSGLIPRAEYASVWWTWWLGDVTGIFIITPFIITWSQFPFIYGSVPKIIEGLGIFCAMMTVGYLNIHSKYPFNYLYFPCIILATLQFQFHGATASLLLLAIILTGQTIQGIGVFVKGDVTADLDHLVFAIMVIAATILILAAELSCRTKIKQTRWAKTPRSLKQCLSDFRRWRRTKFYK